MAISMPEIVNDANYYAIVKKLVSTNTKEKQKGANMQNIPSKGDGVLVRKTFKPRDGWIFLAADLSQIEPRIQAHIMYTRYGDNSMRQIFVDGTDLYTTMAMKVFGLEEKFCVDKAYDPTGKFQPRKMMKQGVLAVSYDQQPPQFAKTMKVSEDIAYMFFDLFNKTFPSFKQMVKDIRDGMKRDGYVETLFGRKRRFPEYNITAAEVKKNERKLMDLYIERSRIRKKNFKNAADLQRLIELEELIKPLAEKRGLVAYWERAAFNAVIQGTGADILKANMVRMTEICKEKGWELNASIHDEIKISIPKSELTPEACQLLTDVMTKSVELSLPLKSDTVIEPVWMEEYDPSEWDFEKQQPKEAA
jgi:DNA polymerase I